MEKVKSLNIGSEGEELVRQAIDEPLDASRIAEGVNTADEALQLFTVSCAVVNVDNDMEAAYLDSLAKALNVPDDVKNDLLHRMYKTA